MVLDFFLRVATTPALCTSRRMMPAHSTRSTSRATSSCMTAWRLGRASCSGRRSPPWWSWRPRDPILCYLQRKVRMVFGRPQVRKVWVVSEGYIQDRVSILFDIPSNCSVLMLIRNCRPQIKNPYLKFFFFLKSVKPFCKKSYILFLNRRNPLYGRFSLFPPKQTESLYSVVNFTSVYDIITPNRPNVYETSQK